MRLLGELTLPDAAAIGMTALQLRGVLRIAAAAEAQANAQPKPKPQSVAVT